MQDHQAVVCILDYQHVYSGEYMHAVVDACMLSETKITMQITKLSCLISIPQV